MVEWGFMGCMVGWGMGLTHVGRQVNIGLSGQVDALVDMLGGPEGRQLGILHSGSSRSGTGGGGHVE